MAGWEDQLRGIQGDDEERNRRIQDRSIIAVCWQPIPMKILS